MQVCMWKIARRGIYYLASVQMHLCRPHMHGTPRELTADVQSMQCPILDCFVYDASTSTGRVLLCCTLTF
jgi:hypothetical protein